MNGRLQPCPETPNCVCSQDTDKRHAIAPLKLYATPEKEWPRLLALLRTTPRLEVVSAVTGYTHVTATTLVLRFTDDVEFLLDSKNGVIQVRSASRVGRSDFGANRKRIESFRKAWDADAAMRGLVGPTTTAPRASR